ncbi:MAG: HobA family DNA replication regulator [Sulfuricurvum sp.]|uniref:HobA family DNA replication regulator n=1 Tax=Sulfuricurvum sp. TaxID=2025608 RepID=UPI0026068413|nr:HobA family DNA replication regulator [Sulfuricurvum sp.]MDD2837525.1 HobA family DNA replication regulator [Sulfuricurvum sp.]MDD3595093.1 HobA family DNA replication regulator [Sulfuricurvum sp.]MDD4884595.1 HobA family DNA replication regulator [Sulfuricurvum sp.]
MRQFDQWTLDSIRSEGAGMSWFEEQRFEWTPAIANALEQIMSGKSIVLITDHDRRWFAHYITASMNKRSQDRPMIPIVCIDALYPHYDHLSGGEAIDTLSDMLDITFKGEYFFWYVGRGDERRSDIAKRCTNSLLWIMDERFQNALVLRSHDSLIDIKLLQLYRLFDKTLNAVLFGEIDVRV